MLKHLALSVQLCVLAGMVSVFAGGCSKPLPPPISMTEAQTKFVERCHSEYQLDVTTRMVGKTFWIYLPTNDPMFDYEAQQQDNLGEQMKSAPPQYTVQFADGTFKERKFYFEYDIVDKKKAPKESSGYNSTYTDSYVKQQNNLFTAISENFFDAEAQPNEIMPLFFVIVIADIKKGIETSAIFYLEDFKRFMSGDLPYDEYIKRFLADVKGGKKIIGDELGEHLEYKDITIPEFLTKQIINRINFKFQHSSFPPKPDFEEEIMGIIADTAYYYKFQDYTSVKLHNLRTDKLYLFNKEQVKTFTRETAPADKGKLIHIRFSTDPDGNGTPEITQISD